MNQRIIFIIFLGEFNLILFFLRNVRGCQELKQDGHYQSKLTTIIIPESMKNNMRIFGFSFFPFGSIDCCPLITLKKIVFFLLNT